jgi:DnaJ-class molecular chaperone
MRDCFQAFPDAACLLFSCRSVEIKIPPGVEDGMQMQVTGRGNAGHNGGRAGNLFVVIQV